MYLKMDKILDTNTSKKGSIIMYKEMYRKIDIIMDKIMYI